MNHKQMVNNYLLLSWSLW